MHNKPPGWTEYVSFSDQNHAPSLTDVRLEFLLKIEIRKRNFVLGLCEMEALKV